MKNSAFSSKKTKKLIRSQYIFSGLDSEPINGYLLIESSKIQAILPFNSFPSSLPPEYEYFDYENSYISPGLIDMNVHLCSQFSENWQDTENITKQALKGGVTTLIDNAIFSNPNENSQSSGILSKFSAWESKIFTDCGTFAGVSPNSLREIDELLAIGAMGLKGYLSPCVDTNHGHFLKKELKFLREALENLEKLGNSSKKPDILLVFHDEMANERDLFLSSPCRAVAKEKRLDFSYKIGKSEDFGGGVVGDLAEMCDSGEEEKGDDVLELEVLRLKDKDIESPTTASLKIQAKLASKTAQDKLIAMLEAKEYRENVEELAELQGEWREIDKELQRSREISPDFSESSLKSDEESDKNEKKLSCPLINKRASLMELPSNFFMKNMKNAIKTAMDESDTPKNTKNSKVFCSPKAKELEDLEKPVKNSEVSDNKCSFSKSPTKKRQSDLILRRKKMASFQADSPLQHILTKFEKHKEEERKDSCLYFTFLSNHPVSWENDGVSFLLKTFRRTFEKLENFKLLVSNLSTAAQAFDIRELKKKAPRLQVFADISVSHLFFCRDMIADGKTKFKSSPPIREKLDMVNSLQSLLLGVFDCVSSAHLQVPKELKLVRDGNFRRAFSGNSCVGYNLQAVWTRLFSMYRQNIEKMGDFKSFSKGNADENLQENKRLQQIFRKLVEVMCSNPAKILGISSKKGMLSKGNDADFVVWRPFEVIEVKRQDILLKYPRIHVMRGQKLYGKVEATFLRGERAFYRENDKEVYAKMGQVLRKHECVREIN